MGQKGWDDLAAGDQTPVDRCEGYVWGRSRAEGVSKVGVLTTPTHEFVEPRFLSPRRVPAPRPCLSLERSSSREYRAAIYPMPLLSRRDRKLGLIPKRQTYPPASRDKAPQLSPDSRRLDTGRSWSRSRSRSRSRPRIAVISTLHTTPPARILFSILLCNRVSRAHA